MSNCEISTSDYDGIVYIKPTSPWINYKSRIFVSSAVWNRERSSKTAQAWEVKIQDERKYTEVIIIFSASCLLQGLPISRLHGKEAKEPRINLELRVHKAEQGFVSCKVPERLCPGSKGYQNETRPSKDWLDQEYLFLMYLQRSRKVNPLWRKNIYM